MGAGKSRIGAGLAEKLGLPFYDTDHQIELQAGLTVSEIFQSMGEAVFRDLECKMIGKLAAEPYPSVIALGGGALMKPCNENLVRESGMLIYLKSSPQSIMNRIKDSDKRPLLRSDPAESGESSLLNRISQLLESRTDTYEKADIIFDRDGLEASDVVKALIRQINHYWESQG